MISETLDLTTLTVAQLDDLLVDLGEYGYELCCAAYEYERSEFEALYAAAVAASGRVRAEQDRRTAVALEDAWLVREHEAEQDGQHTLVGWSSVQV